MYIDDTAAVDWPNLETSHCIVAQIKITFRDSTQASQYLNQVVIYRLTKSQREFATLQGVPQYSSLKRLLASHNTYIKFTIVKLERIRIDITT